MLEAQTLKETRDDPRRSGPTPGILLHDGAGFNGAFFESGVEKEVQQIHLVHPQRVKAIAAAYALLRDGVCFDESIFAAV